MHIHTRAQLPVLDHFRYLRDPALSAWLDVFSRVWICDLIRSASVDAYDVQVSGPICKIAGSCSTGRLLIGLKHY
jgi:hypothetical protein